MMAVLKEKLHVKSGDTVEIYQVKIRASAEGAKDPPKEGK